MILLLYAGHQFGHFNILGDGRAILLGEHVTNNNQRFDIQLKGSGYTAFSRGGDGRATLRAMLREYLISEAMAGLKIPTTRSLAVVKTGAKVYREEAHEGAILTRIASSHIRVGTFEFANRFVPNESSILLDYVIDRHYPELNLSKSKARDLMEAVMLKQIDLIVQWMRVGFIHGVMNTDNMSITGETIDYGPCAFMNTYHPETVFSSIDTQGRYAFGNQPSIAQWNIACFAGSLLSLIHEEKEVAIEMAKEVLNSFPAIYQEKWQDMMFKKLGFSVDLAEPSFPEKAILSEEILSVSGKKDNFKWIGIAPFALELYYLDQLSQKLLLHALQQQLSMFLFQNLQRLVPFLLSFQ